MSLRDIQAKAPAMTALMQELKELRYDPFELLRQLESRLRSARVDSVSGQALTWIGLGFRLGGQWLAAPREDVREVIPPPKVTRIPNAQPWMSGLANVRGELLTIIDLRQLLGMPRAEEMRAQRVMVLNSTEVPAGFLVDEVAGYRQFAPEEQRRELLSGAGALGSYLLGGFVRQGQPWLAMSLHKVAQSDGFRHAGI